MNLTFRVVGGMVAILATSLVAPASSGAEFGIVPGSIIVKTLDTEGNPDNRAGGHPDRLRIDFGLNAEGTGTAARNLFFDISPGLVGNASAVPMCPRKIFGEIEGTCPANTQVGVFSQVLGNEPFLELPIFNIEPAPDEAVTFGITPLWRTPFNASIRPADYGLTLGATDLPQIALGSGYVELWGVPADHQSGTSLPRKPLLTMPTRCGPIAVTVRTQSWLPNAPWLTETGESDALEDCEGLSFDPSIQVTLSNPSPDSPTGARIEFTTPDDDDPDGRASSQIKSSVVQFPDNMSISPAGVEGRMACTDLQFGRRTGVKPACPSSSQIGTIALESSVLRNGIAGDVYLATELPNDRFRMFMAASGPGINIKLVGSLHADPVTGRLSVSLAELPQVPLSRMSLALSGGDRALLATPLACGPSVVTSRFEPYGEGQEVDTVAPVSIGSASACPQTIPFAPDFVAGTSSRIAGHSTSFSMTLLRKDGERIPSRLTVTLPPGLSGRFGAVQRCAGSNISKGTCPDESRIGDAIAEIGSGPTPAVMQGDVYLTDGYRHAPFGLAIVFRATIGPFDLGTIVVRATLELDRRTGQLTVRTDPLPEFIEGVPLRFRTIGIDMDRPGFIRNPTSCTPTSIDATIQARGTSAATATPFVLHGCDKLGFRPRFSMALTGPSELHRHGRPGFSIMVQTRPSDTNIRTMQISLPESLKFSASRLKEICSRADARDGQCSKQARVGTVYARTPLLAQPLEGSIFVVQPEDEGLPDLWLSLAATGVHVDIRGTSSRKNGQFVTTMSDLPDMPLSTIRMRFPHGRHGVFSLSEGPCVGDKSRRFVAPFAATGQDGAFRRYRLRVAAHSPCANDTANGTP